MQSEIACIAFELAHTDDSAAFHHTPVVRLSGTLSGSRSSLESGSLFTSCQSQNIHLVAPTGLSTNLEPDNIIAKIDITKPTTTSLLNLPLELRFRIIEYIVHAEGLPEIRYHKTTRSDLTRPHPLNKTCQQLCYEFNKIQREKAIHVVHHVFGYDRTNSTNKRYTDTTFGALNHIKHVKIVAEFSQSFALRDENGMSMVDIITSECTRFPRAKNVCVELRMSASCLPFYGSHTPNFRATELIFILGIQSHLPSVFLPGPAPIEDWLANIVKQFPNVRRVSLTWEGVRWRDGYIKSREENLLRESLAGMCNEGTEITTVLKQLW